MKQAQKIVVEQLQASGELDGEPRPITHPVKFYERGERPLEIVTSRQWYFRNGGRDPELRDRAPRARPRAALASAAHAQPLRDVDRGPQRRLARSAASATSACRSRSGTASTPTASADHDDPIAAARGRRCPSIRRPTARPASPRTQRDQPGRLRRRPRRDGHVGDVVAHAADRDAAGSTIPTCSRARSRWTCGRRVPRSSARGCSTRSCARGSSTARCRGPTRRSTVGCSTPIARRCRSRRATSSRRCRSSRSTAPTRCATGRATAGPASTPRSTTAIMKIGRKLAIKMLNVSKFVLGVAGDAADDAARSPTPLDRSMLAALADARRRGDRRVRRVRLRACARTHRTLLLVVLRRLRRAREGPRVRRRGRRGRRARPRSTLRIALSTLLRLFAPFLPFVTEEVWSWWQDGSIHRAAWPSRGRAATRRRRPARVRGRGRGARRGAQGEVGAEGVARDAGRRASSCSTPPSGSPRCAPRRRRARRGQDRGELETEVGHRARRSKVELAGAHGAGVSDRAELPTPASWLDSHVNLETGVGVPAGEPPRARRRSSASPRCCSTSARPRWSSRRSTSPARTARPRPCA